MRTFDEKTSQNQKGKPSKIRPKLEFGQPGDKYEKEADAIADRVVSSGNLAQNFSSNSNFEKADGHRKVQMKTDSVGEIKYKKSPTGKIQLKASPSLAMSISGGKNTSEALGSQTGPKAMVQKSSYSDSNSSSGLLSNLQKGKTNGKSLDPDSRQKMESSIGADFSNVKVHTTNDAVQMSQDLGANAFTHGNDIYFNQGKYQPGSQEGDRLLAHELVHTVQQNGAENAIQRDEISLNYSTKSIGEVTFPESNDSSIMIDARCWVQDKNMQNISSVMHYDSGQNLKTTSIKAGTEGYLFQSFWFKISEDNPSWGDYDYHEGKDVVGYFYKASPQGALTLTPVKSFHTGETIGKVTSKARMDRIEYGVEQAAKILGTNLIVKGPETSDTESSSSSEGYSVKGGGTIKVVDIEGGYESSETTGSSKTTQSSNKDLFSFPFSVKLNITNIQKETSVSKRYGTAVYFSLGKSKLTDESKNFLYSWWKNDVPQGVKTKIINGETPIRITGFADSLGSKSDNELLSQSRAIAVRNTLSAWIPGDDFKVQAAWVADNEMTSEGYNEDAAPNQRKSEVFVEDIQKVVSH
jgi:outer membrane protein OmpA-like peptidoglycan-associated protein